MVAIKDMEMPSGCKDCPLTYLDTGDDAYFGANERKCVFDDSCIDGMNERYDDCPLVEIVTCKNCKYYRNEDDDEWCTNHSIHDNKFWVREDYFCADAERRE